jgi:hypothetical protein
LFYLEITDGVPVGDKPDTATIAMTPPFLLNAGNTCVHMHILAPGFRRKVVIIGPWAFIFSAIAEFITIALSANRTCQSKGHYFSPYLFETHLILSLKVEELPLP